MTRIFGEGREARESWDEAWASFCENEIVKTKTLGDATVNSLHRNVSTLTPWQSSGCFSPSLAFVFSLNQNVGTWSWVEDGGVEEDRGVAGFLRRGRKSRGLTRHVEVPEGVVVYASHQANDQRVG